MSKQAVFTMKLEPELRTEFMAQAKADHRPASQIIRELMREYITRQKEAREYEDFLRRKVMAGRESMAAERGIPNEDVEAEFEARRNEAMNQA